MVYLPFHIQKKIPQNLIAGVDPLVSVDKPVKRFYDCLVFLVILVHWLICPTFSMIIRIFV
ncbi:MAG: hypothetical protein LBU34_08505, partial [Planctomycetaceae bacterium]|nr:hypothetical protein [Planctomycetaceae bacterium]